MKRPMKKFCALLLATATMSIVTATPALAATKGPAKPFGICRFLPWMCK